MKKLIAIILILAVLLGLSACEEKPDSGLPVPQISNNEGQVISNDEPPMSGQEPDENFNQNSSVAEPPEGTAKNEFEVNLIDIDGNSKEGSIKFSIYLPKEWTVNSNEIFIDEQKISEIQSGILNEDGSAFEKLSADYSDAVATGKFSAGAYSGQYYHMQSEVSVSGVTAKRNEIVYCLSIGDKIVNITFYPLAGTGIKTQREAFEAVLSSIK